MLSFWHSLHWYPKSKLLERKKRMLCGKPVYFLVNSEAWTHRVSQTDRHRHTNTHTPIHLPTDLYFIYSVSQIDSCGEKLIPLLPVRDTRRGQHFPEHSWQVYETKGALTFPVATQQEQRGLGMHFSNSVIKILEVLNLTGKENLRWL